jgi:RNA polymerase sigma-70 factor, ECF subfamily
MGREMNQELTTKTDQQLVEDVRAGDRSSYSELVKRHQKGLLRLSMRFMKDLDLSQDIVQEAFIKAYEKLNLFEGRSSFKSWLFQIAVNVARNKLRENRYHFMDIDDVEIGVACIAETQLVQNAVGEILQKEVDRLPFKQKTALVLRVYEDLSFAEIAEIMDCPYDTAKANYRHALLKLKEVFQAKVELRTWVSDTTNILSEMNSKYAEAE